MLHLLAYLLLIVSTSAMDDSALCSIVASTNIQSVQTVWACDTSGIATSNYCSWPGVSCDGGNNVVALQLSGANETGLSGEQIISTNTLRLCYVISFVHACRHAFFFFVQSNFAYIPPNHVNVARWAYSRRTFSEFKRTYLYRFKL